MSRTSSRQIEREAIEDLLSVLAARGVAAESRADRAEAGLVVNVDGRRFELEVKARAVASTLPPSWLDRRPKADLLLVVADVVTETAREQLRGVAAGWFDRRGHLFLPPNIDVEVLPRPRQAMSGSPDPLGGRTGLEVAIAALTSPQAQLGVRELARAVGLAPSTISAARTDLIEALLITSEGRPVRPNLFDKVVSRWAPRWQPLADAGPGGLDGVDMVIGGDVGAVMNGAPMAVGSATPVQYYVRTGADIRKVVAVLGEASVLDAQAWVAVAPARIALELAVERESMATPGLSGQVVPAVVSAIELASDPARGREVLEGWDLPEAPWRP